MYRYFKMISGVGNESNIYYWKSKGLSDERINSIKAPNHSITPNLGYYGTGTRVEFNGSCLKQYKVTFNHGKVVNIYIVYEISKIINVSDYPTLEDLDYNGANSYLFVNGKIIHKFKAKDSEIVATPLCLGNI